MLGQALNVLGNSLSGEAFPLINNLNIFPDIFGSFKPFGLDQTLNITLTINALDRSERTEQISAPRVLVANGVTATVKMTKAYYFPEDWEELEIETEEVGETDDLRIDITPPSPKFRKAAKPSVSSLIPKLQLTPVKIQPTSFWSPKDCVTANGKRKNSVLSCGVRLLPQEN